MTEKAMSALWNFLFVPSPHQFLSLCLEHEPRLLLSQWQEGHPLCPDKGCCYKLRFGSGMSPMLPCRSSQTMFLRSTFVVCLSASCCWTRVLVISNFGGGKVFIDHAFRASWHKEHSRAAPCHSRQKAEQNSDKRGTEQGSAWRHVPRVLHLFCSSTVGPKGFWIH